MAKPKIKPPVEPKKLEDCFRARTFAIVSRGCLDQLKSAVSSTSSCVRQMREPDTEGERIIYEAIRNAERLLLSAQADVQKAFEERRQ